MLHKASRIRGAPLHAIDGEVGRVEEFYFDDVSWTIRYLLVVTGSWLAHRPVLIPPNAIDPDWSVAGLSARLTREHVRDCPEFEPHATLSRQHEMQLLVHYGHPPYWDESSEPAAAVDLPRVKSGDDHLCGTREIIGVHLHATDGGVGHVDDFLFDERWTIRYLVVDTSNFIGGKSVVISPAALHDIDRSNEKMYVALTRDEVKRSPSFDSIDVAPGEGVRIWIM
jgi:hypothetical protein